MFFNEPLSPRPLRFRTFSVAILSLIRQKIRKAAWLLGTLLFAVGSLIALRFLACGIVSLFLP